MTKINANGSNDINMLLASPPAAAWANAGVISIRTILVEQVWPRQGRASGARPIRGEFGADYSGQRPNCNAASPRITPHLGRLQPPARPVKGSATKGRGMLESDH